MQHIFLFFYPWKRVFYCLIFFYSKNTSNALVRKDNLDLIQRGAVYLYLLQCSITLLTYVNSLIILLLIAPQHGAGPQRRN